MSKNIEKYLHKEFDKKAGLEHATKRTKIVATVGPACDSYEQLLQLVKAGVNVLRLNFSHGTHEDKLRIIEYIQRKNRSNSKRNNKKWGCKSRSNITRHIATQKRAQPS